jgi:preprotein translocase subunit SecG
MNFWRLPLPETFKGCGQTLEECGMIWESILLALHVIVAVSLIGFVLLQHGKGADMGAAFGSGSSGSLFGAAGSANFLSRTTAILATVFFLSSLGLTYLGANRSAPKDLMQQGVTQKASETAPKSADIPQPTAAPAPAAAPAAAAPASAPGSKSGDVPK